MKHSNFYKVKQLLKTMVTQYQEQTGNTDEYNIQVNKDGLVLTNNLNVILSVTRLEIEGKKNRKTDFKFLKNDKLFAW